MDNEPLIQQKKQTYEKNSIVQNKNVIGDIQSFTTETNEINESQQQDIFTEEMHERQMSVLKKFRKKPVVKGLFLLGIFAVALCQYDNNFQGQLHREIIRITHISDTQFQLFSTLSAGPIIPFIFFGGIILDYIGVRVGMIFYLALMMLGAWIVALGGQLESFWVMLAGKIVATAGIQMGLGAKSALLAKWCDSGELTRNNSIYLCLVRIIITLQSLTLPRLYKVNETLFLPLFIGALVQTLSYVLSLFATYMDYKADKSMDIISKERKKAESKRKFKFSDFKKYNYVFWSTVACFSLTYGGIYLCFCSNISTIFDKKFQLDSTQSGDLQSIAQGIGVLSPLVGMFVKKYGGGYKIFILGNICVLISFGYMFFHPGCTEECYDQLYVPIIFFGIAQSINGIILIPAIAITAPKELLASAYGIAYGFRNSVEALVPIIFIGPLMDNLDVNYTIGYFLIASLISLILSIVLWQFDLKRQKQEDEKVELLEEQVEESIDSYEKNDADKTKDD